MDKFYENDKKINFLVLSLDNEIGLERRNRLNYNYTWIKGKLDIGAPDYIKEKMIFRGFHSEDFKKILIGVWWAWINLLDKIVEEKLNNVIALEDDCLQVEEIDIDKLGHEPIWLNGSIKHPKALSKTNKTWEQSIKLNNGINKLEDVGIRLMSMWGLYIPKWEQAEYIRNELKNSKKFRMFDAQICNQNLVKYLYYPSKFIHKDFGKSCAQKQGGKWENIRYYNFRKID